MKTSNHHFFIILFLICGMIRGSSSGTRTTTRTTIGTTIGTTTDKDHPTIVTGSSRDSVKNVGNLHLITMNHNVKNNEILLSFVAFDCTFHFYLQQNKLMGVDLMDLMDEDVDEDRNILEVDNWKVSLADHMYNVYKGVMLHTAPNMDLKSISNPSTSLNQSTIKNSFARIVIHSHDPDNLLFDGTFYAPTHGMMHLKLASDYEKSRRHGDAPLPSSDTPTTNMILIRDMNPRDLICLKDSHAHASSNSESNSNSTTIPSSKCSSLYKRDLAPAVQTCATESTIQIPNLKLSNNLFPKVPGIVRAALGSGNQPCPLANKKVLAMGVAADCSYVAEKGGVSQALAAILSNWNSASQIYESTFNVQLGVVKVKIMQTCTPLDASERWNRDCSDSSYLISNRLSDFSSWRGTQSDDGMGLWHLMTKCSTQPSVGIAWVSQLCTTTAISQSGQSVSGTGVSSIVPVEWKVVAHEIGHAFGAQHDCSSTSGCGGNCRPCSPSCDCQSQYLMNPLDNSVSNDFSPASIQDMCIGINALGSCLQDPGRLALVSAGVCGNGIREGNEQCDCGPASGSTCLQDACCEGSTCFLKPNMQCDPLNDACCSNTCRILPANTVCHRGDGICDNTVTCPGTNATCPINTFVDDGSSCTRKDGKQATCSSGICTSRDLQCTGNSSSVTTVGACPAFGNECTLNCRDVGGNCFQLTGFFLDGTTCGGTGKCKNGACIGSTLISKTLLWIQTNPQYAYPIIAGFGIVLLLMLYGICRRCCCAPSRPKQKKRSNRISELSAQSPAFVSNETLYQEQTAYPNQQQDSFQYQQGQYQYQQQQQDLVYQQGYPAARPLSTPALQSPGGSWESEDYWKRTSTMAAKGPVVALRNSNCI